mgnify:CR=1 FL=1
MAKPRTTPERSGFQCAHCGQWHDELLTDVACGLPDAVFELGYLERYRRARYNPDFCTLDETRHFIRCVLPVPFTHRDDYFGWGVWVEVDRATHELCLQLFDTEGAAAVPPLQGRFPMRLANHAAFHSALQAPVAERGRARLAPSLSWRTRCGYSVACSGSHCSEALARIKSCGSAACQVAMSAME